MNTTSLLSAIQPQCHQTSRSKGWWDPCVHLGKPSEDPRINLDYRLVLATVPEKVALIHSEIVEAHTEYDEHGKLMWFSNGEEPRKPEGWYAEIADVVIRVFDLMGALGAKDWTTYPPTTFVNFLPGDSYERQCNLLHRYTSAVLEAYRDHASVEELCTRLAYIVQAVDYTVVDGAFAEALQLKLAYNKTRPHRHGGKKV